VQLAIAATPRGQAMPTLGNATHATFLASQKRVDDLVLVQACKCGDVAAFEELVKRYQQKLLRVAQGLTHNHEDAQDVVQEALLKAFQKLDQFQGNAKFSTWLFRINVNQSQMKIRKRLGASMLIFEGFRAENPAPICEMADRAPNPEELCRTSELRQILRRASTILKPRLRVVFVLRDIEGLSIDQTAEILQLNHSAVKSRLRRARIQLRDQLSRRFGVQEKIIDIPFRAAGNGQSQRRPSALFSA
jgi:RNA polymerase sigma-70 factor (ECF subfamily)